MFFSWHFFLQCSSGYTCVRLPIVFEAAQIICKPNVMSRIKGKAIMSPSVTWDMASAIHTKWYGLHNVKNICHVLFVRPKRASGCPLVFSFLSVKESVCERRFVCVCVYVCLWVCMCERENESVCVCVCVWVRMCVCVCVNAWGCVWMCWCSIRERLVVFVKI